MTTIDHTHDPDAVSWVESANSHGEFPVQNLPLGVFSLADEGPRIGTAIGEKIADLHGLNEIGMLPPNLAAALSASDLNALLASSAEERCALRHHLFALLTDGSMAERLGPFLHSSHQCMMHLPARIGDYTDFYTGIHHAANIGKQFRPENPLLPNYKHVPIGYHGRASSVRVSGAPVHRPLGQIKSPGADCPDYSLTSRLDYELELGVWIAGENSLGTPVPIDQTGERVAGLCLLNDWSARDIQAWEYQPLGPFLSKSFMTTISPWVVTSEALAPFRSPQPSRPEGDPQPLPYLWDTTDQAQGAYDITLEVTLSTAGMRREGHGDQVLSRGPADNMYWTVAQMVAHHTANGCNLMPGDLLGSGTISGQEKSSWGSLMELSEGGRTPIDLPSGETRTFLETGDVVTLFGHAHADGYRTIGFGSCRGEIV